MIIGKDYLLSDSDIDACIQSGAFKQFSMKGILFEDALVQSGAAPSKGFLRKNKNAVKTYVFSGEISDGSKVFKSHELLAGVQDDSVKEVLVSVGKKFFMYKN